MQQDFRLRDVKHSILDSALRCSPLLTSGLAPVGVVERVGVFGQWEM
jgi:hypothetical protein